MMANQDNEHITGIRNISWPAYHSTDSTDKCKKDKGKVISCLLSLFYDVAHSEAMICHSMKIVKLAVNHLNADQIPILTVNQPLFSIAKRI